MSIMFFKPLESIIKGQFSFIFGLMTQFTCRQYPPRRRRRTQRMIRWMGICGHTAHHVDIIMYNKDQGHEFLMNHHHIVRGDIHGSRSSITSNDFRTKIVSMESWTTLILSMQNGSNWAPKIFSTLSEYLERLAWYIYRHSMHPF